eukprot:UN05743
MPLLPSVQGPPPPPADVVKAFSYTPNEQHYYKHHYGKMNNSNIQNGVFQGYNQNLVQLFNSIFFKH